MAVVSWAKSCDEIENMVGWNIYQKYPSFWVDDFDIYNIYHDMIICLF